MHNSTRADKRCQKEKGEETAPRQNPSGQTDEQDSLGHSQKGRFSGVHIPATQRCCFGFQHRARASTLYQRPIGWPIHIVTIQNKAVHGDWGVASLVLGTNLLDIVTFPFTRHTTILSPGQACLYNPLFILYSASFPHR